MQRYSSLFKIKSNEVLQTKLTLGGVIFEKYHKLFPKDGEVLKRLYKQMYEYLYLNF